MKLLISMDEQFRQVAEAFSLTAEKYDRFAEDHPNLMRIRSRAYAHLLKHLEPGARILELNAGTGTDAVRLAQLGFYVHATDIAPGMLERLRLKVTRQGLQDRVSVEERSYTELDKIQNGLFDAVFSNLGGLNCITDLHLVIRDLPCVLRPGGIVIWVLMPPICLWELALAFTGNFKVAFRRLSYKNCAHLEGRYFPIYYFTPSQVVHTFEPDYTLLDIEGLSVFSPPAEVKFFGTRHPTLYRWMCWLDSRLAHRYPFYGWGDFFVLCLKHAPAQL